MTKIIDIEAYNHDYRDCLESTIKELTSIKNQLYDMMVYLALSGKWKEWEVKQPLGTEFTFDLNMLLDSGDKNIDEIFKLYEKTLETIENLKV